MKPPIPRGPRRKRVIGVNAKAGLYPSARSWSGGRFRVLGKGPLDSKTVALGIKAFVEGIFKAQRVQFSPKRTQGARRMTESDAPFHTMRHLRVKPIK